MGFGGRASVDRGWLISYRREVYSLLTTRYSLLAARYFQSQSDESRRRQAACNSGTLPVAASHTIGSSTAK